MLLDIIIVNYNVKFYLEQCLLSVRNATEGIDVSVWVVDNNSRDGSMDYLEPLFPDVHFIRESQNLGFSKANNKAIRQSNGKYVLILNPDTIITRASIINSIELLEKHPEIGSTGVSMYGANGVYARESKRAVPTVSVSFFKMIGLSNCFPNNKLFSKYHLGYLDAKKENEIEIVSGAFNMMRRATLDEVGLLDEDFFMYGEDIDLSYRMLVAGWKNWYLPSPIIHYKGESAHDSTAKYVFVFYQAMIIFYDKHFGSRYSLPAILIRVAVFLKGILSFFTQLERGLKKRFVSSRKTYKAYFLGADEQKECVAGLLGKSNIQLTDVQEGSDFWVFDNSNYSYDEMIEIIISQNGKHRADICVYDSKKRIIIMPREILM